MHKTNIIPFVRKNLLLFLFLLIIIFLELIKFDSNFIENYYSNSFYNYSSYILLYTLGKIPFPHLLFILISVENTPEEKILKIYYIFL